jgi:hypothetical protein
MKRDLQLVKKILLHFEEKTDWTGEKKLTIAGYDDKLVSYHVDILFEAGLINGEPSKTKEGRIHDVLPFRLTWEGHEFLDSIRGGRWETIMKKVRDSGGNFTFELIKKLATKLAEDQLLT